MVLFLVASILFGNAFGAVYNESTAISNLFYAYGGYCPEDLLKSWTCKWCYNHSDFEVYSVRETSHLKGNLQAFTGYDPSNQQIVISFRGSSNTENWIDDFDYFQVPYPGINGAYIHSGFYSGFDALSRTILPDYQKLLEKRAGAKTLVTGHSLGAALAQVAALNFSHNPLAGRIETWTYGSPRFGNKELSQYYSKQIDVNWRMVNVHDIVPTVPPNYMVPGVTSAYHHTGTEIWYESDSPLTYKQCDGSGEDRKCDYIVPSAEDHLEYMNIHESCK